MLFPVPLHSLTKSVEDEIHQIVRNQDPIKYWSFRISDIIGKFGMTMSFFTIFLLIIFLVAFQTQIPRGTPEYEHTIEFAAEFMVASTVPGLIGVIVRSGLYDKLQPLVRKAAQSIKDSLD